jgi:hypothetical protein
MEKGLLNNPLFHILLIVTLSLIAYSNTFSVPFHFDDKSVIVENPAIKDLQYFSSPSKVKAFTEHFGYHTFRSRYIGYLTFALNYSIHGLDTTGYHIVNLVIHVCTSLLVYLLVHLTFKTSFLLTSKLRDYSQQIALFAALLFACHPVQTEAVTYIWQRVASLATMFYLLSLTAPATRSVRSRSEFREKAENYRSHIRALVSDHYPFCCPCHEDKADFLYPAGYDCPL